MFGVDLVMGSVGSGLGSMKGSSGISLGSDSAEVSLSTSIPSRKKIKNYQQENYTYLDKVLENNVKGKIQCIIIREF